MQPTKLPNSSAWLKDILFLAAVFGLLYFVFLGSRPLFVPDEGRYAEIAREMVASNDYITPHLNGIKYFEKPILFYWLGAIALKFGGINIWSIRIINALLGIMGCLLTYATIRQLFDRRTGLLAAFILGTSTLYFIMSHMVSLDLPVTVFLMSCFYFFLLGISPLLSKKTNTLTPYYFWGAALAAACAVLTKGLIGIIFPLVIIGAWVLVLNQWRNLKYFFIPSSLLIFFLIAAPWHVMVGLRNPEFFYFYFIEQHFLRYTTMDVGHYQPVWFFIPTLILGFFPWIVFLPQACVNQLSLAIKNRVNHPLEVFFLLWAFLIFVFFSFSKSKLIPYILPIFPPLSILTARYMVLHFNKNAWGIKLGLLGLFILSAGIAYSFYSYTHQTQLPDPMRARLLLSTAALILLIGVLVANIIAYKNIAKAITLTIITTSLFLLISLSAIPAIETRTIKPLADTLKPLLKPGDEIITYNQYYQDLPFYLERKVTILNWQNELSYGMNHQDASDWMINDRIFWQRFHSDKRVYVILSLEGYYELIKTHPKEQFTLIGSTINNALISNKNKI